MNAVGPGPVETPPLAKGTGGDAHSYAAFVPMGRIGQPEEIADAVVWLLSDEARYVTGHTLPVDGGVCSQERVIKVGGFKGMRDARATRAVYVGEGPETTGHTLNLGELG